jgi:hypothetical protein
MEEEHHPREDVQHEMQMLLRWDVHALTAVQTPRGRKTAHMLPRAPQHQADIRRARWCHFPGNGTA